MLFKKFELNIKSVITLLVGSSLIFAGVMIWSFSLGYFLDTLLK